MQPETPQGLSILSHGTVTRLKWHRMRRSMADPVFSLSSLRAGLALGASLELDLRVRADGGFAVVHDATLDRETTGTGPVATLTLADLATIAYDDGGTESARPLVTSEDLSTALKTADPGALLQLDMKDDLEAIGEKGIDHLAGLFGVAPVPIIVSGGDPDLIAAIGRRVPALLRGVDPTDRLVAAFRSEGHDAVTRTLAAELAGPTDPDTVYLAWELVLAARAEGLDLIGQVHAAGRKVDAWTFTLAAPDEGFSEQEWTAFSALLALGPDQITTDEPIATERAYRARIAGTHA